MHGAGRVHLYLTAQASDIDAQVFGLATVGISPYPLEQSFMRKNFTWVQHQFLQQVKFGRCQFDQFTMAPDAPLLKIDLQITKTLYACRFRNIAPVI